MARAMPVGTTRVWQQGVYIKAHDGTEFSSGWIPLRIDKEIEDIGRKLDELGKGIIREKLPINGERYLDHEIKQFTYEGVEINPEDFKKYEGFEGAAKYSFFNELSRMAMEDKIALKTQIEDELVNASRVKDLSPEDIAEIKERVKANFQSVSNVDVLGLAKHLLPIVERIHTQLKQGVNFEGEDKVVYDSALNVAKTLEDKYKPIREVKQLVKETKEKINKRFKDNWAVQASFEEFIDDRYDDYKRRYRKEIFEDATKEQASTFGVSVETPLDEFYKALYSKLKSNPSLDFYELCELRFDVLYNKRLKGEFDSPDFLPVLHAIEGIAESLPSGHFTSNHQLRSFVKLDDNRKGYAFYSTGSNEISLSLDLLEEAKELDLNKRKVTFADFTSKNFLHVLRHEIGHAVTQKIGRLTNLQYRTFMKSVGWSMAQHDIRQKYIATGDNSDYRRGGSNQDRPLITEYAHKSPEEAFAEYYSFYGTYKKEIDSWLDTGKEDQLKQSSSLIVAQVLSDFTNTTTIGALRNFETPVSEVETVNSSFLKMRFSNKAITTELISPWDCTDMPYIAGYVKTEKEPNTPITALVIKNSDSSYTPFSERESSSIMAAKIRKEPIQVAAISQECYVKLSSQGYTKDQIKAFLHASTGTTDVAPNYKQTKAKRVTGLEYANQTVPFETILRNKEPFLMMRQIYYSDELKKALQTILFSEDENDLEKGGKKGFIGEKRIWDGKTYKKQLDGSWKEESEDDYDTEYYEQIASKAKKKLLNDEKLTEEEVSGFIVNDRMYWSGARLLEFMRGYYSNTVKPNDPELERRVKVVSALLKQINPVKSDKVVRFDKRDFSTFYKEGDLFTDPAFLFASERDDFDPKELDTDTPYQTKIIITNPKTAKAVWEHDHHAFGFGGVYGRKEVVFEKDFKGKILSIKKQGETTVVTMEEIAKEAQTLGMQHLNQLVSITSGKQHDFFNWQLQNAESVMIEKIPQEIKEKLPKNEFKVKQCYVNAYKMCQSIPGARYVEGLVFIHGIPIDHAWVELNGKHYDPTEEFALNGQSLLTDYTAVQKYTELEIAKHAMDTGTYGPYLENAFKYSESQ